MTTHAKTAATFLLIALAFLHSYSQAQGIEHPITSYSTQLHNINSAYPLVQQMVNAVSSSNLMANVQALQGFGTRYEYSLQQEAAATWIMDELNRQGVKSESDWFTFGTETFYDLEVLNQTRAWLVGTGATVLTTTDGGSTWSVQKTPADGSQTLYGVDFVDDTTGWAVGYQLTIGMDGSVESIGGLIIKTTDGGKTWIPQESGVGAILNDVSFANERVGVAVGSSGIMLRTNDGGTTWHSSNPVGGATMKEVILVDSSNAWAVGYGGTIIHSTDGGVSWTRQSSGVQANLCAVDFVSSLLGWAVGDSRTVLKTTDGGATWTTLPIPPQAHYRSSSRILYDVCFTDSVTGWIADYAGSILRTTDGGQSWTRIDALRRYGWIGLTRIRAYGNKNLLSCGNNGALVVSADGGATWVRRTPNLPPEVLHTSRNIVVTIPGLVTPERECFIVAHYDAGNNTPGADDNASGTSAVMEAARILSNYRFESTIKLIAVSGEELGMMGSEEYASRARSESRTILGVVNADMIAYPLKGDTTRLVVGSYLTRNRMVDSALVYNLRYGIGATLDPFVDSTGASDYGPFAMAGYDALDVSEGTPPEIWGGGNPYYHKPTDTIDKLHPGLMRRATQLIVAIVAEIGKPMLIPQKQWTWESPVQQWVDLRALYSVDENNIFAVGDFGTVARSTNGGQTWTRQIAMTNADLRDVWFTDAKRGTAVGSSGTLVQTSDGGVTWNVRSLDPTVNFYGVCYTDSSTGTIVGNSGAIYRTTDGGATWVSQVRGPASTLQSVSFTDENTGTIVGSEGIILRTTNGGKWWYRQYSRTTDLLYGVWFTDANTGTAVGKSGTILRTTDGGYTWMPQNSGTTYQLFAVHFTNADTGTVVGEGGTILRTTDGGATWTSTLLGETYWFTSASFVNSSTGTVVGSTGSIFRTTDGGSTWTLQTPGPRSAFYAVALADAKRATTVGYQGSIFHSSNGGKTWVAQASGTMQNLWGVAFPEPGTGLAVGEQGTILRTTDAGASWKNQGISPTAFASTWFSGVSFGTSSTGVIVGKLDTLINPQATETRSFILRSTNRGGSWVRRPNTWKQWLTAVSFGDANTATAVGEGGIIIRTTDGGVSWTAPEEPFVSVRLNGVSMVGADIATVVGDQGTILRTTDGGTSWTPQHSGTTRRLSGVWFVNAIHGLAVGDYGTMLRTSNGGATWIPQAGGTTSDLYAVHFCYVDRGGVVGRWGTILMTSPGDLPVDVREDEQVSAAIEFTLSQNYPNPFNAMTNLEFRIGKTELVSLKVFDLLGRDVATLVNDERRPGVYKVVWDASRFPSGLYICRLQAGTHTETKKMLLIK